MGLGSLLVSGVPVGGTVSPPPRQASLAPAVISIPAVSPAVILVIQALPGEWGDGDFGDWEDIRTSLFLPGERGRRFSG